MSFKSYPPSILHEITTGDGFGITCKQWIPDGEKKPYPAFLINGYVHDVYCLPTEPRDMVRTLLDEGYETWLLQPRLHPANPSNDFTMDDIGKYDIPSAIAKVCELHGPSVKIHVIAHCAGGLSIHMALMGGHISPVNIASLSCTNSSMYFKLTKLNLVKLTLPLIHISMAILGKDTILPLIENSKESYRQWILKSITRLIPRYERCTYDECTVVSGVFGNPYWHENITPTLHHWLNRQAQVTLPMSGLRQIAKIGSTGHIVNATGEEVYLTHPERIPLPTLYLSGGRSIVATPETSLLAHQYMKLHHPGFHHERVVVDGFGHSDVLLGEESYKKVFPHIISHMKFVEQGLVADSNAKN
ncbi:Glucose-methanol-choline oxidoreductase [Cinnamomum micranthum f. kanehirae]|uniref:Glucose-methanol-choline oxidoreductase n=1 Tax=Cinnamomum micranthum f. kanehirae TaxID=337451 RepID=A0A443N0G9_9MAGN|nr:Glucose-methanol-choline oxidoreductase [Cinnamomum micranthum f. kanehirae]